MPPRTSKRKMESRADAKPRKPEAVKRRKKKETSSAEVKGRGVTLSDMPMDVLLEIFQLLQPADLVTLAFMSKSMYVTMRLDHCKPAWKEARERIRLVAPLEDMSELEWAWLVFNSYCMSCGVDYRHCVIDFMLRRRVCSKCKEKNVISLEDFSTEFPELDESILRLVAPTHGFELEDISISRDQNLFHWWKDDIRWMATTVASSLATRSAEDHEEFVKTRKATVRRRFYEATEMTYRYKRWLAYYKGWERRLDAEKLTKKQLKFSAGVIQRLIGLGHMPQDVDKCSGLIEQTSYYKRNPDLTDEVWTYMRKELEPKITKAAAERLEREDKQERNSRRTLFDRLYAQYHSSVDHAQWRYMPPSAAVRQHPQCRAIIELPKNIKVTEKNFEDVFANMDNILKDIQAKKKADMIASIKTLQGATGFPRAVQKANPETLLELAPFVHICADCEDAVFGWDHISSHCCFKFRSESSRSREVLFEPDIHLTKAAIHVVRKSGQPVESTTVAEMDALGLLYVCTSCIPSKTLPAMAYEWRNCVYHLDEHHGHSVARAKIITLSPADAAALRAANPDLDYEHGPKSAWACTHCTAHIPESVPYASALLHVQKEHAVESPVKSVDIVNMHRRAKPFVVKYQAE